MVRCHLSVALGLIANQELNMRLSTYGKLLWVPLEAPWGLSVIIDHKWLAQHEARVEMPMICHKPSPVDWVKPHADDLKHRY